MKTNSRTFFIIALVIGILFIFYMFYATYQGRKANISYSVTGVVDSVEYSIKGYPTVIINRKTYDLSDGYNFDYKIQKGDSLIKKNGSNIYKLIKRGSGKVFEFTN